MYTYSNASQSTERCGKYVRNLYYLVRRGCTLCRNNNDIMILPEVGEARRQALMKLKRERPNASNHSESQKSNSSSPLDPNAVDVSNLASQDVPQEVSHPVQNKQEAKVASLSPASLQIIRRNLFPKTIRSWLARMYNVSDSSDSSVGSTIEDDHKKKVGILNGSATESSTQGATTVESAEKDNEVAEQLRLPATSFKGYPCLHSESGTIEDLSRGSQHPKLPWIEAKPKNNRLEPIPQTYASKSEQLLLFTQSLAERLPLVDGSPELRVGDSSSNQSNCDSHEPSRSCDSPAEDLDSIF